VLINQIDAPKGSAEARHECVFDAYATYAAEQFALAVAHADIYGVLSVSVVEGMELRPVE
jgi:hypothetical protein